MLLAWLSPSSSFSSALAAALFALVVLVIVQPPPPSMSVSAAAAAWTTVAPTLPNIYPTDKVAEQRPATAAVDTLLLVSTIDGYMSAIDAHTGTHKWRFHEGPLLSSPVSIQRGFTFIPNPRDGQLYLVVEGRLSKLPFTIPHLVRVSPCRSSDGVFYAGSKKDVWISIDPETGDRSNTFSPIPHSSVCPASMPNAVHIGKTEYHIQMMDTKRRDRHWNATFVDYSAHLLPEDTKYPLQHFTSSVDGRVLTVDAQTGTVLWQKDFGSVIVNMYLLKGDGMHKLPSTAIGQETFDTLAQNAVIPRGVDTLLHIPAKLPDRLFPTLYVGESAQTGLYALPAFVDERTSTLAPKYLGPPLLEGPKPADGTAEGASSSPPVPRKRPVLPPNTIMLSPTYITKEGEFLLLGYHHLPEAIHTEHLFPVQGPHSSAVHDMTNTNNNRMLLLGQQSQNSQKRSPAVAADHSPYHHHHYYAADGIGTGHPKLPGSTEFDQTHADSTIINQNKAFLLMAGALLLLIIVFISSIFILRRYLRSYNELLRPVLPRRERLSSSASWGAASSAVTALDGGGIGTGGDASWSSSRGSANSRASRTSSMHTAPETDHQLGWHRVNDKLRYDSRAVLGRGCDGTFVYRGQFDGRDVAVKRVQALLSADNNWHRIIDREVTHLRESDSHPNVIRYFCSESDPYFSYIALELCDHTLEDFINQRRGKNMDRRLKLELLRQATDGIAHLHSIKIVHRDVKPKNILINGVTKDPPRVKISDFGLCKTVKLGHNSISKVSGVVGTEGWMAPELWDPTASVTYAIDVFSLGCVFYYVLTEGEHPFGDPNVRLYNISMNKFNLSQLEDSDHIARSLIASMLRLNAALRPTSSILVAHPIFWEPVKQLQFLLEVSDRIEKLESRDLIMRWLECRRAVVVGNWLNRIDEPLKIDLLKQRSYQNNVRDLLRAIRNKKHHYQELSLELRSLLGRLPDEYIAYFTKRFPQLLMHSFMALAPWAHETVFRRDFYPTDQLVEFYEREREMIAKTDPPRNSSPYERRRSSSPSNWRSSSALSRPATPTRNAAGGGIIVPAPNANIAADGIDGDIKFKQVPVQLVPAFDPSMPPPPAAPPALRLPNAPQHVPATQPKQQPEPPATEAATASANDGQQQQQQQQEQWQQKVVVATRSKAAKERAKKLANKRKRRRKAPFSVLASASSSSSTTALGPAADDDDDAEEENGEEDADGAEDDEDSVGSGGGGAEGDEAAILERQKRANGEAVDDGRANERTATATAVLGVESREQPMGMLEEEEKQSAGWEIVGGNGRCL